MPSRPGHLDVEQGHVRVVLEDGRDHLVAGADLGDHLEVGLEAEQRGQRAAHQRLVVGEQQPDRHPRTTCSEKPGESCPGHDRRARRRRPARAGRPARSPSRWSVPPVPPVPSSRTSALVGVSRTSQVRAPGVPDHVGDALADRPGEELAQLGGHLVGGVGQVGLDLGRRQRDAGADQLAGQGEVAVALDRAPYVGRARRG